MNSQPIDYRPMWAGLGLNLDKHEALMAALDELYSETYLSQSRRPRAMKYFDRVIGEVHGLRIQELLQAQRLGHKVVGSLCVLVPEELVLAFDGVSIGLCAGAEFGTEEAERYLPKNTCALVKSFFGLTLDRICPYFATADLVVGEVTCDGKKKSYESFGPLAKRFHLMDMPQTKSAEGRRLLRSEYARLIAELESLNGRPLNLEGLRVAVRTVNAKRDAVARLNRLRESNPTPISGLDALLIQQISFYDEPVRFTEAVNALCNELEERVARSAGVGGNGTPRVLLSGCPMAMPNWKVPALIERSGAVIVGEESCVGARGLRQQTVDTGTTIDELLDAIVDRYWQIDCAIFSPNRERLEHAKKMARALGVDGVVHYALQFCTPFQMESLGLERQLEAAELPVLRIETDFGQGDIESMRARVEAFIEQIAA